MSPTSLADRLRAAELVVARVTPAEAVAAAGDGAVIVDIRSPATRARDGVIAGSLSLPLTVLHWRLEPGGSWRTPYVPEGARVVLVCDQLTLALPSMLKPTPRVVPAGVGAVVAPVSCRANLL